MAVTAVVIRDENAGADPITSKLEKEKQQADMEAEELEAMLPIRKPKHLLDGATSGLKLAAGGVITGAFLRACPPCCMFRSPRAPHAQRMPCLLCCCHVMRHAGVRVMCVSAAARANVPFRWA